MHQLDWCNMIRTLSEIAQVQSGHPFRGSVPVVADGNAFALQMRDVSLNDGVAWRGLVQTQVDGRKTPEWLQPGDVVFVARGARNFALCLQDVPIPAVCSQYFFLLRIRDLAVLLPEFLAWQINSAPAQRYLSSNAEGSDQLSIRRGVLENLSIAVPSIAKQRLMIDLANQARQERKTLESLILNRQRQLDALAYQLLAQ